MRDLASAYRGAVAASGVVLLLLAAATVSQAYLPPSFSWTTAPEAVDQGVVALSAPGGVPMIRTEDTCGVVYAKEGDIYLALRTESGWQLPLRVTEDPADSRNPQLVLVLSTWHVIWEDNRAGHPEVWTRRWDGAAWSAEELLTAGDAPSRSPSVAGDLHGSAIVAWQDGPDPNTTIVARLWNGSAWSGAETISHGSARAQEPSVAMAPWGPHVVWSDTRHGQAEIYLTSLTWEGWEPEIRLTDMAGNCRRPSVHLADCCGDYLNVVMLVTFENDQTGLSEIWGVRWWRNELLPIAERISANDGVPSHDAHVDGFTYLNDDIMGGVFDNFQVTWTDGLTSGALVHRFAFYPSAPEILSPAGLATSFTAADDESPWAGITMAWIENDEFDVPTLYARQARALSCLRPVVLVGTFALLSPSGLPTNSIRLRNYCVSPAPWVGAQVRLDFSDPALRLTWDSAQPHPLTPIVISDDQGVADIGVRGGGCSPTGMVWLQINQLTFRGLQGAKSPDVNGDCAVLDDDLAYVQSRLGSSDYCADLDGSGLVDAPDVAIVESTLGGLCSNLVGVDEPVAGSSVMDVRVLPNPCRETATLLLRVGLAGLVDVDVFDASGRLVRNLGQGALDRGVASLSWDTRDQAGRAVPSGVYFVLVRSAGQEVRRTLLVLR